MSKTTFLLLLLIPLFSCQVQDKQGLNEEVLASMGKSIKNSFSQAADDLRAIVEDDPSNVEALMGITDTEVLLYIFGYKSRKETLPAAREALQKAKALDSTSSNIHKLSGIIQFLDWNWTDSKTSFLNAIETDPQNLIARHWYSLYLSAMGRFDEAMAQSDTIAGMDPAGNYQIGRGSLMYFARRNQELKELMIKAIARDTTVAWGYDWLGMAYIELQEYDQSIETYFKAFELADGTVEVGAGLGHALGLAGRTKLAKQMADYYSMAARDHYLPPVQRAFVHIGIEEYEEALNLLEQAYVEQSWFLIFMQVEPWLDPIRNDDRFSAIMRRMKFPN